MRDIKIRNLETIDFDTIFHAFGRSFADYAISFEKEEVRSMLKRRGFNPRLSFAAFDGEEIIAFTLNGTGTYNGLPTAYDTGTGTVKEYRGRGIAQEIFNHSVPHLKAAGIKQYLLEVLQDNQKAISVYRKLGVEVTRDFDCFRQKTSALCSPSHKKAPAGITIAPISLKEIAASHTYCDFHPSWQNSLESIERAGTDLRHLGAYDDAGKLTGYCVVDPVSGDITQIAVTPEQRGNGIATLLLRTAFPSVSSGNIKALNIPRECEAMRSFLLAWNFCPSAAQFEMSLPL